VDLLWGHYKDEPGTATTLIPFQYTSADEGWMYLEPDEEYEFGFEWYWQFDPGLPGARDVADTMRGIAGREYLNAASGDKAALFDAAHMKLAFKLTVEQVD
jgi:hypothetical protein